MPYVYRLAGLALHQVRRLRDFRLGKGLLLKSKRIAFLMLRGGARHCFEPLGKGLGAATGAVPHGFRARRTVLPGQLVLAPCVFPQSIVRLWTFLHVLVTVPVFPFSSDMF